MKIALFVHCFFPHHYYGTETYTLELAKNYQLAGHQVTVVSAFPEGENPSPELVTRYQYDGLAVISFDKNRILQARFKDSYYQTGMRHHLEQLLAELQPDIVHVNHLANHTSTLLEATHRLGIATYATFTDFFGFCANSKLQAADGSLCSGPSPSRRNCVACYFRESNVATSFRAANWLAAGALKARRLPGLRTGRFDGLIEDIVQRPATLQYLYNLSYRGAIAPTQFLEKAYRDNGVTVPMRKVWFGTDIDRRAKPQRAGTHQVVFGFIGQLAPHKGIDLLLQAFRTLPGNTSRLRIYGSLDSESPFGRQLSDLARGYDVSFMGTFAPHEMASVMRELDLLVIPSRWPENSPLVLLNALATHTPVLVADVAGMTEFLEPDRNGYSFRSGDAEDLASRLRMLAAQPSTLYALADSTSYSRSTMEMALDTLAMYGVDIAPIVASRALGDEHRQGTTGAHSYVVRQPLPDPGERPRVIHVIANFMTGGSSRLVVDLIEHLGNRYEQSVVTSYIPNPPAYTEVDITEYRSPQSDQVFLDHFTRVQPAFIHVHYWGDYDEPWYVKAFSAAERLQIPIVENINTPVAPHLSMSVQRFIYVSDYVRQTFGGSNSAHITIHPGSDFRHFSNPEDRIPPTPDCVGMVYRLERDKLNEDSILPFIDIVAKKPATRVLIIGAVVYTFRAVVRWILRKARFSLAETASGIFQ